jgi:hypothetical protein
MMQEEKEEKKDDNLVAKFRLKERNSDGKFGPLLVSHDSHPALIRIINAFNNSNNVKLGYSTITKDKGAVEPTMKKKNIYLAGEAVRDHLANKKITNYHCVTEASPDEIKLILKSAFGKFEEVKPETQAIDTIKKYKNLPSHTDERYYFYPSRWDQEGQEIEITAVANGQKVKICPFCLHDKNGEVVPLKAKFSTSIEQDAASRDVTINAMYIKLKENNGENGELIDPEGGMHDLRSEIVRLIRKPEQTFSKNPYLPFILCNIAARFAEDGKISSDLAEASADFNFPTLDSRILANLFLSAVENSDVPVAKYLMNLKKCQILAKMFPKLHISDNLCKEIDCSRIPNSKVLALALVLLNSDPSNTENLLKSSGFKSLDAENVGFLLKLARLVRSNTRNPSALSNLFEKPAYLSKGMIHHFLNILGSPEFYYKFVDSELV